MNKKYTNNKETNRNQNNKQKKDSFKKSGFNNVKIKGIVDVRSGGYGFVKDEEGNRYFIYSDKLNCAISGDKVLAQVTKNVACKIKNDGDRLERAEVLEILERNKKEVVGRFTKQFINQFIGYVDTISGNFCHRVYVSGANVSAGDEDIVKVKIVSYGEKTGGVLFGEIVENLGKLSDKGVDISAVILEHNLHEHFSAEVLEEAEKIPQEVNDIDYPDRKKFYGENIVTIDGEDARDFDDAVQIKKEGENYRVFIHIADPTEYVKPGSKIDTEVFERGTSVYFPHRVLPMLPKSLSNGICSLNPNLKRLALTCEVLLDKNCDVITSEVYESIVISKHRMTYTSVQKILDGDKAECEKYSDMVDDILDLNKVAKKLEKRAVANGKIEFESDECYIEVDENGRAIALTKRESNDSHRLIENFMILANCVLAKKFFYLKVPFVYRAHEEPEAEKIDDFNILAKNFGITFASKNKGKVTAKDFQIFLDKIKDKPWKGLLSRFLIRTQQKAKYNAFLTSHFGLGEEFYCHFTSPIRRLADFTIHRIIKDYLRNSTQNLTVKWQDIAVENAIQASKTEIEAERAEREVDDMKKAEYMTQFIGSEFSGIISGAIPAGFFVELDNTAEGFVSARTIEEVSGKKLSFMQKTKEFVNGGLKFRVGDAVKVILTRANPEERKIDLMPVSVLNLKNKN